MALTTFLNLELLEVGQKDKEITINTNFSSIDSKVIRYLGELSADPSAVGVSPGTTYFNTSASKIKVLKSNGIWVTPDGSATPTITWGDISGKPTTLPGYSLEDDVDAKIAAIPVPTSFNTLSVNTLTVPTKLVLNADTLVMNSDASSYGWQDLVASFTVKATSGLNNPSWSNLFNGMEGYTFSPSSMNQVWVDFHIVHDIALGTVLYPHVHWTPTTTGTGTVRWGIEYTVAKGHQQATGSVFPATTTVYVEQNIAAASQWKHFISEVSVGNAIPATNIEPDSVIKMRVFRDASHANDTYAGDVHAWQADLHYQVATLSTKNKAPNFYA